MTPGFSLRRIFNRRRYYYDRVAVDPQQENIMYSEAMKKRQHRRDNGESR